MKQTIHVDSITEKKTKTGTTFVTMKTNVGQVNCFDSNIIYSIRANIANDLVVEIDENGTFKNITQFIGPASPTERVAEVPANKYMGNNNHIPMIMSYAKDLLVAGKIDYDDFGLCCGSLLQTYKEMVKQNEIK